MKGRVILIDEPAERASQAALLVDGRLEDLLLDPLKGDTTPAPGEIYWAKVDRLVPKMHGAFVQLTPERTGFLREAKGLKEGRGVLVQVVAYAEPSKATPVTTRILYKGRRIIHTPDAPGINVSRQIKDETERKRLIEIISAWEPSPEHSREPACSYFVDLHRKGGFIVRTAAKQASEKELHRELGWVLAARSEREAVTRSTEPGKTGLASLAADIAVREWTGDRFDSIVVGRKAQRWFLRQTTKDRRASDDIEAAIQPFDGPDLFDHYGVREEIERLKSPRVDLPSGGWMAVEATRAMVTVDVNTAAEFSAGAALSANLEAARELPRQLRLRGLGGQVIVDFAPLRKTDRRRIEDALRTAFRRDPVETTLAGWTPLGHFELQRKRERRPLAELLA